MKVIRRVVHQDGDEDSGKQKDNRLTGTPPADESKTNCASGGKEPKTDESAPDSTASKKIFLVAIVHESWERPAILQDSSYDQRDRPFALLLSFRA